MDWRTTSRSQSRARGSGVGMGMGVGVGVGMEWHPGSRSQSRSRPSQLYLHTAGVQGFEFDDPANDNNTNGSANANGNVGNVEGGVAIPQSIRSSGQGAGAAGSGSGSGSGRSLLTKSLQIFGESPPVVGLGGWTGIGRPPHAQQQVRQIGDVAPSQPGDSSEEHHLKTEQLEAQNEEDFGGFLPSSLPAYHLGFSYTQPPTATTTTTTNASPYAKHVRSTSFDHSLAMDGNAASEHLGGRQVNQRPHPPKVPESALVCHLIMYKRRV